MGAPADAFAHTAREGEPLTCQIGSRLLRPVAQSHEYQRGEPTERRLRIFTSDPAASRLEGRIAIARVPYEPLEALAGNDQHAPCLRSSLFEVCMLDVDGRQLEPPQLDEAHQLIQDGYAASESNPQFHAQMVYAVASLVHTSFRRALGREPGWSFGPRLRIYPLGAHEKNAWYDPAAGELRFGYDEDANRGWVFTSLSHDIVAHEVTHALLDSQRPHFMEPTSFDVMGFHEGFADLIALFQHFQYPEALRHALQSARSVLLARHDDEDASDWLCSIARQWSECDDSNTPRRADRPPQASYYRPTLEGHAMGEVLLCAVFDAFDTVYRRQTARLRRLATNGSGELPFGCLSGDLVEALAQRAAKLAEHFTALIVRALDYCPPVDIKLAEFLRAMITADHALNPDDPCAIREALIDAFRVRGVMPRNVLTLSEDSLLWNPPRVELPKVTRLSFGQTRFGSAPGRPVPAEERQDQARALCTWLLQPQAFEECGLVCPSDPRLEAQHASVTRPCIDALETTCRVDLDGQVQFETVAVVTQTITVAAQGNTPGFSFVGGCTLLFSPQGELRMCISKSVLGKDRIERRRAFITGESSTAQRHWQARDGVMQRRSLRVQ